MIDCTLITAHAAERIACKKDDYCSVFGPLTKARPDCSTVWRESALLPTRVSRDDEHF